MILGSQHALSSNFECQSTNNLKQKVIVETLPQISEIGLVPKVQVQEVSECIDKMETKVSEEQETEIVVAVRKL